MFSLQIPTGGLPLVYRNTTWSDRSVWVQAWWWGNHPVHPGAPNRSWGTFSLLYNSERLTKITSRISVTQPHAWPLKSAHYSQVQFPFFHEITVLMFLSFSTSSWWRGRTRRWPGLPSLSRTTSSLRSELFHFSQQKTSNGIQLRASMPLFFSGKHIYKILLNTNEKFRFFTDGKPANVRGFSETPVGIFWLTKVPGKKFWTLKPASASTPAPAWRLGCQALAVWWGGAEVRY